MAREIHFATILHVIRRNLLFDFKGKMNGP